MVRRGAKPHGLRLLALVLPLAALGAAPARAACEDILPGPVSGGAPRTVTPEDIAALRDIGFPDASYVPAESPLAVSPDGRRVAFVITRARPAANRYCRALAVIDLMPGARPHLLDSGGEYMAMSYGLRGLIVDPGAPEVVIPAWSPDGRSIAFRKRVDGRTEAWIAAADGSGARSAARLAVDVDALAWSEDGARLVLASRPGLALQERALAREALSGYLYDDRFQPNDADRPALLAGEPRELQSVVLAGGAIVAASPDDLRRMRPDYDPALAAALVSVSPVKRRAWLARETGSVLSPMRLHAEAGDGRPMACRSDMCLGAISSLLWLGDAVFYLRREGWAKGTYALYRWAPGDAAPRRLFATDDAVQGCVAAGARLACLIENATTPRRLVTVDPRSGARAVIFDPNPEFRAIRLSTVRRLRIVNAMAIEAWGDLALPPGYRGGRIPLVVVQYNSRGFLRGGTGDDYPIHAFAARGMAVLSLERPMPVALLDPAAKTADELNAANTRGWADKRSILSAIETGVAEAVRLGVADPRRVGITGLSDGATTTAFALLNSRTFAAAAMSSCCYEPQTTMIYGGPRWAEMMRGNGFPPLGRGDPAFWAPISLSRGAAAISAPILLQIADREYLLSLEAWAALKQAGKTVELYVYPDEYHNKWQPAHRLAAYRRSLDWFDFWLAGRRDPDPAKADQYRRWDALKRQRDAVP